MIRRRLSATALTLAVGLALAGCAASTAEPTAWQGVVQTLASQASGGDYASASATLDQLEADVTAQRDTGALAADEAQAILTRIATVRADLTSLLPSPEPTTSDTPASVVEDTPEPAQTTQEEQSQEPAEPSEKGPGNSGNSGKGNGGKGKSEEAPGLGGSGKKDG